MIEKRKSPRIPEISEISYKLIPKAKVSTFITKDISKGGVRFFSHEYLPLRSHLKIKIKIKKKPFTFEALAEVRWIQRDTTGDRFEVGAKFIDLSTEAEEFFRNLKVKTAKG